MATFSILTNDILEVTIGQIHNSQRVMNVLHYQYRPSVTITDGDAEVARVLTVLSGIAPSLVATMKLGQSNELHYDFIRGSMVHPIRRRYIHLGIGGTGAVVENSFPPNVSLVVTKQSSIAGRGRSGRMSIGGVPLSRVENGIVTADGLDYLNQVAGRLEETIAVPGHALGWTPVLWSPGQVGVAPGIADAFPQATSRVVRRRTVGQGI